MVTQIQLKILTPEKEIYCDFVDCVTVPAPGGPLGILPHHTNLMSKVSSGELIIKKGSSTEFLAVGDGFLQVIDKEALVLTDLAKTHSEIDEKLAEEARIRAQEALAKTLSDEEYATTLAALEKSLAQLRVKRRHKRM